MTESMSIEKDIESIIGEDLAKKLYERIGGTSIYIPGTPAKSSQLVLAIGRPAVVKLCNALPAQYFYLKSKESERTTKRLDLIKFDLSRGISVRECALRHGLSEQYIRKIRKKQKATK